MNFLAHAYLSFDDPETIVGNMISDFVKGQQKLTYPAGIQRGIQLHRLIDSYTDTHTATRSAKEIFRPAYRLYSGAFVDVVYDHFLAADETEFSEEALFAFSQRIYAVLEEYRPWLPERFAGMFNHMQAQNWLFHYRSLAGARNSLGGLVRRAAYMSDSETAYQLFRGHYQPLRDFYRQFWVDVKTFARGQFDSLYSG